VPQSSAWGDMTRVDTDLQKSTDRHLPGQASPGFRRDISGLRAVAVLPILFSHIGVRGFGGGYIGVDVFFVISGYLITGILVRDMAAKRYSLGEFYRRRILRIFPALFAMLLVVTVVSAIIMLPGELIRYARSLGATALFGSNMMFYTESGYFDSASHVKPLLHTWSLAIEEQFYLIWPLLLAVVGVQNRKALLWTFIGIIAASLISAEVLTRVDLSAAFYLLPTRAWELALGGLVAITPYRPSNRILREFLAVSAIAMIGYCTLRYSSLTIFPGISAALPCVGAALLISTGPDTAVGRILSISPAVFIGEISYSLYLWHWPTIIFAQILLVPQTSLVMAGEIAVSFLLAVLSWRFVEKPFRDHGWRWSSRSILTVGLAVSIATIGTAAALLAAGGLPARFTPQQQALASFNDQDFEAQYRRGSCFVTGRLDTLAPDCMTPRAGQRPQLLLVGDSMAADLWPGFARHISSLDVLQATIVGCPPGLYPPSWSTFKCQSFFRETLTNWQPPKIPSAVLLSGLWHSSDMAVLKNALIALRRRGIKVIVAGPMPNYVAALPRILIAADQRRDPDLIIRSQDSDMFALDKDMHEMVTRNGATYVSPVELLCHGRQCRTLAAPGVPLQFDKSHLTPAGSALVVGLMLPQISAALER
jgi:peptidoglycan/LPS O-acetylase OafA/YrhL